ncbi:MAG: outer membrane lipoprotein carrier protein LolA [Candidatus Cloacimonetes bacterium]|jgi:outer membrane lipoprotein-sorting protein|nr:outer membrane lipoprotein carrier protein LolA [Candidatus Cloacimonadota bacterium]
MKKIKLVLLILFAMSLGANTTELYQKMNARYQKINSFEADIIQTNHFAAMDKNIEYKGKFYFQKDRLLLSYSKPMRQRLYIANEKAELYEESSKTLFKSAILPEFSQMNPIDILQEYWGKSDVSILSKGKNTTKVQLKPHNDRQFAKITAVLDESGLARELSYDDKSGNTVHYRFESIKINRGISPDIWKFSYPKDTRIIER